MALGKCIFLIVWVSLQLSYLAVMSYANDYLVLWVKKNNYMLSLPLLKINSKINVNHSNSACFITILLSCKEVLSIELSLAFEAVSL